MCISLVRMMPWVAVAVGTMLPGCACFRHPEVRRMRHNTMHSRSLPLRCQQSDGDSASNVDWETAMKQLRERELQQLQEERDKARRHE